MLSKVKYTFDSEEFFRFVKDTAMLKYMHKKHKEAIQSEEQTQERFC